MAKDKWFYNEQKQALAEHLAKPNGTLYARYQGQMGDMVAEVLTKACPRNEGEWNRDTGLALVRRLTDDSRFQLQLEGTIYTVIRWAGPGEPGDYDWETRRAMPPPAAPRLDKIEARLDSVETWFKGLEGRLQTVEQHLRELGL